MLRLPAALIEDISLRAGQLAALSQTCTALWRVLNQTDTQLRFYLAAQRRRSLTHSCSSATSSCLAAGFPGSQEAADELAGLGPATVYELLTCRAKPKDAQSTLRLCQLMLACGSTIQLFPAEQQPAVQEMLAATDSRDVPQAASIIMTALPHAQHCLLQFCAARGHLHLVKVLLPKATAPVRLHGVMHYVKTSAFLAAAAGGHVAVLTELLAAGAARWACQLPGDSVTSSALDLAALGGHMEAMQLLSHYVANPSPHFLTAAADSGSCVAMEWALQHWFGQFNAVTAFSSAHVLQMHDALKVSCARGHVSAVRQLIAALHRINNDDCCVLALSYASSTSNTDAIQAVLESPQLPVQLSRGGPKLLSKLTQAVASCLRIAVLKHCRPALDLLLQSLTSSSSPIAVVRPLLAPQMRFIFDQTAQSGNGTALQLLLMHMPEHWEALGVSALEAALSEGHADVAATIKTLLMMQGPDAAAAAAALSPEGNPGLAKASLNGAFKGACVRGDTAALVSLLQQGPEGPDDNMQLLLLRLAAGAGKEEAVRLLLDAFGGAGPRLEANLKAVCRGAVHAGQLQLLQSLASNAPSSVLLSHITSQPEALAEYLRAALLCGQVDVAAWLVLLAHKQQEMELVRSTLSSLLTTSTWELPNAGQGGAVHEVVFTLVKRLAAHSLPASSSMSVGSSGTSVQEVPPLQAAAGMPVPTGAPPALVAAAAAPTDVMLASTAVDGEARNAPDSTGRTVSSLGRELLQPQLLGQLLHVSQGYPWRLFTLVELVDWWGLPTGSQQHQQQIPQIQQLQRQEEAQAAQQPACAGAGTSTSTSTHGTPQEQQAQQQQAMTEEQHALVPDGGCAVRHSSSSASVTSTDSARDSSSVTSSGSGDAACDVVSPCNTCPGAAGPSPSLGHSNAAAVLLPANSMEVGSLHSDDSQHTNNWLDDLILRGSAGRPEAQQQQQQQQQPHTQQPAQRSPLRQQSVCQQQQSHAPQQLDQLPPLAKEWGGSWQQLTGQVAQLHMDGIKCTQQQRQRQRQRQDSVRQPRQSFDYEQHVAQQLRRRHQQPQQGGVGHRGAGRESSPGRRVQSATAGRQLRTSLSQPQALAARCPVHPYMQQCRVQQQDAEK